MVDLAERNLLLKWLFPIKKHARLNIGLELIIDTELLDQKLGLSFLGDVEELIKILASVVKTSRTQTE